MALCWVSDRRRRSRAAADMTAGQGGWVLDPGSPRPSLQEPGQSGLPAEGCLLHLSSLLERASHFSEAFQSPVVETDFVSETGVEGRC